MYRAEWRYVYSDISVGSWRRISDLPVRGSIMEAYASLSEFLGLVPDRVGFTEKPDCGHIRPARFTDAEPTGLFGFSIFQHPLDDHYQYRIVETADAPDEESERFIVL